MGIGCLKFSSNVRGRASVLYHRTLNVGRVVSPTLSLLVQREAEIKAFQSEPFYTVKLEVGKFVASGDKLKNKQDAEKLKAFP